MHRQPLLHLLDRYVARIPDEDAVVTRIRRLVTAHADCFERTCWPGHITGSAWVLSADGKRALLHHHGKLDRWLQLGGHCDGETHVEQTARREALEESGLLDLELVHLGDELLPLDLDVHVIPARGAEPEHEHHDVRFLFIVAAEHETAIVRSAESNELRWLTAAELAQVTDEDSVLRLWRKGAAWYEALRR